MAHAPVFEGQVDERGDLLIFDLDRFQRYLKNTLRGGRVRIVVSREKKDRSNEQNRYYHGVVVDLLAEHCGYTHDEMHEAIKWQFLKREEQGKPIPTVGSTAALSTIEFEELMGRIREWAAAELGLWIPQPHEVEVTA